jgi:type I restriction enzyme S subunit
MSNALTNIENKPSLRASHCEDEGRRNLKQSHPLVPELRFKGFEGDWTKEKAGELCDCIVPGRNKPKQFDGDIAWITTPDIVHNSYIFNSKSGLGISKEEAKSVGSKIAPKNSVIISCVGDLGLVAIAGIELVINQQLHAFLPSEKVEYRFLMYSITTQGRYIDRVATKTAVPYMNKNNCNSIPVHLPSLPEQQKIASFLSAVDEKIQQLTKKKALLEQYKKGLMQKLFSGQLRFKDEKGKDYPDWERGRFSKFIKLYRGSSPRPIVKYVTTDESGVNWIKIGDTKQSENYRVSSVSEKITREGSLKSRFVKKGEIILANSMSFGKSYLLEVSGCIYDGWFVLREYEESFDKEFMLQVLNSDLLQRQYLRLSTGGVVQNINSDIVYSTLLFCPVIEEQQKIARYLSRIDTKIESVNNQITQTQTFKKGLLQQMFV